MKALPVGIVLVLVVLLAAGCRTSADTSAGDDDGEDAPAPYGTCAIGAASADVELTVDGYGADAVCDELIRAFAENGDLWRRHLPDETLPTICELEEPGGAGVISVRDSGGAYHAQLLCAGGIAEGWFDVTGD